MGFNDQEIVALLGGHALGRCHANRSGFDGPWTFSPTVVTNDFYKLLLDSKWEWKKWDGPKQVSTCSQGWRTGQGASVTRLTNLDHSMPTRRPSP